MADTPPIVDPPRQWSGTVRWLVLETTVVVIGILIALALNSWWMERQDARRATSYLTRISEDLERDADALDKRRTYFERVREFGDAALAHAESGTLRQGSPWATVVAYLHASQIWPYVSTSRTYDEMLSAGDLGLIDDASLRAALADYYDDSEVSQGNWIFSVIPEYRNRIRGLAPIDVQDYFFRTCSAQDVYENQVLLDCDAPLPESEARDLLDRFDADPDLARQLTAWMSNLLVTDVIIGLTGEVAADLAGEVREAAGLTGA